MPELHTNGVNLSYVEGGEGDQTVVFSHSYLLDHTHFDPQIAALRDRYRVVAYDHRGHGQSEIVRSSYDLQALVDDAIGVIEQTDSAPCHWVGLSTGGFVGMRLALQRPELLRSLVLMDTSAEKEPLKARLKYEAMFVAVRLFGWRAVVSTAMDKLFGQTFMKAPRFESERQAWQEHLRDTDIKAAIQFGRAIFGRDDVRAELRDVRVRTLVMVGEEDVAQPPFRARRLQDAIPGAEFVLIPGAGHVCTIIRPEEVNEALRAFLEDV